MKQDEINRLYLHCEINIPSKDQPKFLDEENIVSAHDVAFLATQVACRNFRFGELTPPL
jgi:hypothetical protein